MVGMLCPVGSIMRLRPSCLACCIGVSVAGQARERRRGDTSSVFAGFPASQGARCRDPEQ